MEQADVFSASQSFAMDGCGGEQPELFIRVCLSTSVGGRTWKIVFYGEGLVFVQTAATRR